MAREYIGRLSGAVNRRAPANAGGIAVLPHPSAVACCTSRSPFHVKLLFRYVFPKVQIDQALIRDSAILRQSPEVVDRALIQSKPQLLEGYIPVWLKLLLGGLV